MKNTLKVVSLLMLMLSINSFSQNKKDFVGKKLPDSPVELLLQAPVSSIDSWKKLEGKWLFLEFWATWCAPCIARMPALNKLGKEMSDKEIQFISLSPEKPEIVKRFLKRKSIAGWVGIDSDKSFIEALKISSYPTTVLVSPDGKVYSYPDTRTVDKEYLLQAMSDYSKKKK